MRKSQAVALARTIVVIIGRTTINSDIWKQFLAIHVVFFCIFEIVNQFFDECQSQGCPIGIPKNPEISCSSRKSSLGAAQEVHSARAKYRESRVGGGVGLVTELSTKKMMFCRN